MSGLSPGGKSVYSRQLFIDGYMTPKRGSTGALFAPLGSGKSVFYPPQLFRNFRQAKDGPRRIFVLIPLRANVDSAAAGAKALFPALASSISSPKGGDKQSFRSSGIVYSTTGKFVVRALARDLSSIVGADDLVLFDESHALDAAQLYMAGELDSLARKGAIYGCLRLSATPPSDAKWPEDRNGQPLVRGLEWRFNYSFWAAALQRILSF